MPAAVSEALSAALSYLRCPSKLNPSDLASSSSAAAAASVKMQKTSSPSSTSASLRLHFFVRVDSRSLVIHAYPIETINSVINRILSITGTIPSSDLRLVHRCRNLDGDSTLADSSVHDDATLHLTARFCSTPYHRSWQLVNDIASALGSLDNDAGTSDLTAKEDTLISLINAFLALANAEYTDDYSFDVWGHFEVFLLAIPAALVKLYLTPDHNKKLIAFKAIMLFVETDPELLPKHVHLKCTPVLLEFCKLLSASAGRLDLLYGQCRRALAGLLQDPESGYFVRFPSAETVRELLPFFSELAEDVLLELSAPPMYVSSARVDQFSGFLCGIEQAVKNFMGGNGTIPKGLYNSNHLETEDWMSSLHVIFIRLLSMLDQSFAKMESILDQKGTVMNKSSWLVASSIHPILAECCHFFTIFEGAEELLHSILLARRSALNLLLKNVGRNERLFWILKHKDLVDSEIRRKSVLMMFPEYEVEPHEMLIERSRLLAESFEYIAHVDAASLHGGIQIEFNNEVATGYGVLREWFCLICRELFSPKNVLFLSCPNDRRRFFPNPASAVEPMHLEYFSFCGRMIALALMHNVQVGIVFDRVFFLQLAGESVTLKDIQYTDPCLYMSCKNILEMDADILDSDALGLTFVREIKELGSHKTIELCLRGKDVVVNSRNRENYVDLLIKNCFVTSISEQVAFFAEGFGDILTHSENRKFFFQCLDLEDFNQMLGGTDSNINLIEWEAHTDYNGYQTTDSQIQWFWKGSISLRCWGRERFEQAVSDQRCVTRDNASPFLFAFPQTEPSDPLICHRSSLTEDCPTACPLRFCVALTIRDLISREDDLFSLGEINHAGIASDFLRLAQKHHAR